MGTDWVASARAALLRRRDRLGLWGYRIDTFPCVEATSLACLGLLGEIDGPGREVVETVGRGSDWLLSMQREDGSLGVASRIPDRGWPTAYALIFWVVLGELRSHRARAAAWLLGERGRPVVQDQAVESSILGHDPTLIGWPWIDGTHSWLEPTALAVLALACEGLGRHGRVAEGIRLMNDRALPAGGWNYGNRAVFGRELRPHPGPSGLALTALASVPGSGNSGVVGRAIAYLERILPTVHAPVSLGWGVIGMKAWGRCPDEASLWLARSHALHAARPDSTTGLALLLIAQQPGKLLAAMRRPPEVQPS